MKKLMLSMLCACFALSASFAFAKKDDAAGTVEILHKPDDQAVIIRVSVNALAAHIAHGDCVFDGSGEPGPEKKPNVDDFPNCEDEEDDA